VVEGRLDAVIFFHDPLATNVAAAEVLIQSPLR
jgi:methylglyoxal synthase